MCAATLAVNLGLTTTTAHCQCIFWRRHLCRSIATALFCSKVGGPQPGGSRCEQSPSAKSGWLGCLHTLARKACFRAQLAWHTAAALQITHARDHSFSLLLSTCSTKFAVEGLSEAMALTVPQTGVGVTLVEPGPARTATLQRFAQLMDLVRLGDFHSSERTCM